MMATMESVTRPTCERHRKWTKWRRARRAVVTSGSLICAPSLCFVKKPHAGTRKFTIVPQPDMYASVWRLCAGDGQISRPTNGLVVKLYHQCRSRMASYERRGREAVRSGFRASKRDWSRRSSSITAMASDFSKPAKWRMLRAKTHRAWENAWRRILRAWMKISGARVRIEESPFGDRRREFPGFPRPYRPKHSFFIG